ncbi:MAG: hypothetical protein FD122_3339 [Stygiobacter sp.]|nr:MAG: hypothetical protein FD122_3339 [Stygiobacter sp.]KAF0214780.1 MAG: hypothetical protein FD178_2153 [Ignavibacteria bacterium]
MVVMSESIIYLAPSLLSDFIPAGWNALNGSVKTKKGRNFRYILNRGTGMPTHKEVRKRVHFWTQLSACSCVFENYQFSVKNSAIAALIIY